MQRMSPTIRSFLARSSLLIAPLALGACLDQGPVASVDPPLVVIPSTALQSFECMGSISGTITCDSPGSAAAAPAGIVVGGQGTYLQLASSNVSYDGGTEVFSFDVTVQNLLREAIGTPDGSTPDPDGIRVFFADGPTATDGNGTITVLNADGVGTFTGSDQPYFSYNEILQRNEESALRRWELGIPSSVNTFSFTVFVETEVEPLLVINEIMANPGGGTGTAGQWFEIYNAGTLAVNLQTLVVADSSASGRSPYHVIGQSVRVVSGGYAVLGSSSDANLNGGVSVDYAYGGALDLETASAAVAIARVVGPDTLSIDRVEWADGSIAAREGVSRELVSPGLDNTFVDDLNWVDGSEEFGAGGLGTPGEANTALSIVPQVLTPVAGQDQSAPVGTAVDIAPAVRVEDAFGTPLAGQQVVFTVTAGGGSLTGDTATTAADGIAAVGSWTLGASSGTNTLEARVGGLTQVFNAEGTLDCMTMAVGEVWTTTLNDAAQACFTGTTVQEYTFMPVNPTTSALSLTVTGSGIQGVTGPPTPAPGQEQQGNSLRLPDDGSLDPISRSAADPLPSTRAARGMGARVPMGTGMQRAITPGVPAVGDLWELNVAPGCTGTPDLRTGSVRSVGTSVIVVADTANPPGGFVTAQYDSIVAEADSIAYPVVTDNFGAPSDIDGNGRIVLFYTRAVNELSPPASSVATQGLFLARDLFPATGEGCSQSNLGEILYLLVPDPLGVVNSNVRTVSSVRGSTMSTIGSELQRLVNASRRVVVNGGGDLEDPWLDRGLSAIVQELMFYRTSVGLTPGQNIQLSTLTTGTSASRRVAAFNTYANQNFGRFRSWLQRPDTSGVYRTNETLAQQGVLWAFLRYAADRRGGNQADFWASLVDSNLTGKANLANAIGADPDEWLRDFVASVYADDAVAGIPSTYSQPSWNFRSVFGGLGGFPLGTRPLTNDVGLTLSYAAGGSTAFIRFGVAAGGEGVITLTTGGEPTVSTNPLAVVRTR